MKALASGHEAVALDGDEWAGQLEHWKGYTKGLVRLSPGRWLLPTPFIRFADKYYNFKFKASDVVVMTYSKSGTTWTQEIVWTMLNNPDLTHPKASTQLFTRSPFLEMDMITMQRRPALSTLRHPIFKAFFKKCFGKNPNNGVLLQLTGALKDPRTIKTHLPFSLLNPALLDTAKVVAVVRNPKDVLVSFHHHCRLINAHGFVGSFDEFVEYFVNDDLFYGPYWLHLKEIWERREHPNLHIMFYEELKQDALAEITKLDAFLGTGLTEAQLGNVVRHTTFAAMKERDTIAGGHTELFDAQVMQKDGGFFRKGQAGDWKGRFTPELEAKVDRYIEDKLGHLDIPLKFS